MYISIIVSIAVFASDVYTAVVLIAFDRWSSQIKPFISISISRWIFAGCIILSVILYIYDFLVVWPVMKGKNVSLNYTNPISRNLYSIYGYRYFCLFAKITKSRSKTEYLAFYVYFTLKGWIRLIFAESPRQVLNGLTLYSVLKISTDFVQTIEQLANTSLVEAVVISFMAFSFVIWVFNCIQFVFALLCACPLYVHVEKTSSGLEEYIFVRINKRIAEIVEKAHRKGLKDLVNENKGFNRQPTLPTVAIEDEEKALESFDDIFKANDEKQVYTITNSPYENSRGILNGSDSTIVSPYIDGAMVKRDDSQRSLESVDSQQGLLTKDQRMDMNRAPSFGSIRDKNPYQMNSGFNSQATLVNSRQASVNFRAPSVNSNFRQQGGSVRFNHQLYGNDPYGQMSVPPPMPPLPPQFGIAGVANVPLPFHPLQRQFPQNNNRDPRVNDEMIELQDNLHHKPSVQFGPVRSVSAAFVGTQSSEDGPS